MNARLATRVARVAVLVIATGVATAAPADPNNSKSINTFIKCLNDTGKPKDSIADLIDACVPDKCKMTLTKRALRRLARWADASFPA